MFSKILLKLIDKAIIPAILIVTTRLVSILIISRYLNIDVAITKNGMWVSDESFYILLNSYSMLVVDVVISLGILFTLLSSSLFHHEVIKPSTTAKLFALKLSSLIKNSFEIQNSYFKIPMLRIGSDCPICLDKH